MLNAVSAPVTAPASSADRIFRNVVYLSGSLVATSIMTILWTLFVPRRIGAHGMGLIVMAWSGYSIFGAVGSFGMRTMLVREIAANVRRAPQLLGSAIIVRLLSILPFLLITGLYVQLGHFRDEQALVLYLATGVAVCLLLSDPYLAAFQAIERMKYLALADVLNKTLLSACGIALVVMGFGATALVALMLASAATVLALNVVWCRRYFSIDWHVEPARLAALVKDSLPYWGYSLFSTFYLWVGSAMLAVMVPTYVVGWYGGPTKLLGTLMFVPVILSMAWLPKLVSAFTESPDRLRQVAHVPTEQMLVLSLPVSVGGALIADPLIRFLYGPEFLPSIVVFIVLTLCVVPTYFNWAAYQILVACKRQAVWTKALAFVSVVNPILNLVLIPTFQGRYGNGAIGAALSFLITELLLLGIAVMVIHPFLQRQTLTRVLKSALATLGMAGAVWLAGAVSPVGGGLVVKVAVGATTFVALALLLRIATSEEIRVVRRQLRLEHAHV
jgi:O-antigen/teichoic acid export membrane protein